LNVINPKKAKPMRDRKPKQTVFPERLLALMESGTRFLRGFSNEYLSAIAKTGGDGKAGLVPGEDVC
jgi:hypothetical protein